MKCYLTETPNTDAFRALVMDNLSVNRHVREEVNGPR